MSQISQMHRILETLSKRLDQGPFTLGHFLDDFRDYGHTVVCLFFAAPFLLPIPLPGLSTVFGAVIILASSQLILGIDPWVPKSWRQKPLPSDSFKKVLNGMTKISSALNSITSRRLAYLTNSSLSKRVNGLAILILALLLSLPMPPGFNAPPALGIIIFSIAILENDGLFAIVAYVLWVLNIALFSLFFALGWEGFMHILEKIRG